jgi:DNA-binding MarR family transcriptional regulator
MELELLELFPKHSELRLYAVRLLLHLSELGPQSQSQLSEILDLELYKLSRLLSKLELHNYINRERKGIEKIVTLREME